MVVKVITNILQIIVLLTQISCGVYFLKKYSRNRKKIEFNYMNIIYALFYILICIGQGIYFYYLTFLTDFNPVLYDSFMEYFIAGSAFHVAGLSVILLITERRILKGKDKYLLFISVIFIVILIFLSKTRKEAENLTLLGCALAMILPLFLWLYLVFKTVGAIRKNAALIFFGIIIYLLGMLASVSGINAFFVELTGLENRWIYSVGYIIRITAMFLLARGFNRD